MVEAAHAEGAAALAAAVEAARLQALADGERAAAPALEAAATRASELEGRVSALEAERVEAEEEKEAAEKVKLEREKEERLKAEKAAAALQREREAAHEATLEAPEAALEAQALLAKIESDQKAGDRWQANGLTVGNAHLKSAQRYLRAAEAGEEEHATSRFLSPFSTAVSPHPPASPSEIRTAVTRAPQSPPRPAAVSPPLPRPADAPAEQRSAGQVWPMAWPITLASPQSATVSQGLIDKLTQLQNFSSDMFTSQELELLREMQRTQAISKIAKQHMRELCEDCWSPLQGPCDS